MLARLTLIPALLIALPCWSQVQPSATGDLGPSDEDTQMVVPPLLSGALYPTMGADDERTNFFTGSVTATGAYLDNVNGSGITDEPISIAPTITYNSTLPRQQESFIYSPSFTAYQNATGLNAFDQSASGKYQARFTPHITVVVEDTFVRTSNVFNTPYPFSSGGVGGSSQIPGPAIIAPFAEQMSNNLNGDVSYQISSQSMIGGGGNFMNSSVPNQTTQTSGIYDSNGSIGSAFYNRRISHSQYFGLTYEFTKILDDPTNLRVHSQMNQILPFYSLTFAHRYSMTTTVGAVQVDVTQSGNATYGSWSPVAILSLGWQGNKASIAGSYLHTVAAGAGLLGAFTTNNGNVAGGWRFSRSWRADSSFSYQSNAAYSPNIVLGYSGGTAITGAVSLQHSFGDHVNLVGGYDRLHEEYSTQPNNSQQNISIFPDTDRVYVSLTAQFSKSLRR